MTLSRKIAASAANAGITPLEVMLTAMREDWAASCEMMLDANSVPPDEVANWQARITALRSSAIATADRAAPYLHARLTSVDTTVKSDNTHRVVSDKPLTKDEWAEKYATQATPVIVANDRAA